MTRVCQRQVAALDAKNLHSARRNAGFHGARQRGLPEAPLVDLLAKA